MGQFRFGYFTTAYDATVAFHRDDLGFPVLEAWDRGPDDRGTLLRAGAGVIEILTRPSGASSHFWDERPPQGAFMVIEVDDVDERYRRAVERRLPIQQPLADQEWGHRSFCVREPNGLTIYFFTPIAGD